MFLKLNTHIHGTNWNQNLHFNSNALASMNKKRWLHMLKWAQFYQLWDIKTSFECATYCYCCCFSFCFCFCPCFPQLVRVHLDFLTKHLLLQIAKTLPEIHMHAISNSILTIKPKMFWYRHIACLVAQKQKLTTHIFIYRLLDKLSLHLSLAAPAFFSISTKISNVTRLSIKTYSLV